MAEHDPDATLIDSPKGPGSGSGSLPKGAMAPKRASSDHIYKTLPVRSPLSPNRRTPSEEALSSPSPPPFSPNRRDTSPRASSTPAQAGAGMYSGSRTPPETPGHVQFASYPPLLRDDSLNEKEWQQAPRTPYPPSALESWTPLPLRTWFWVLFVIILAGLAIGLEVALHFSQKHNGWSTKMDITSKNDALHYAYTLPPVIIAGMIVAMWTWTDVEVKKLQPYVDLARGGSPPQRSLLLDYTRVNTWVMPTRALYNRHYLVALASLMSLVILSFTPLASALLVVSDIWLPTRTSTMTSTAIGLNQNSGFQDLSVFLTGAGFASAQVLYDLDMPAFINQQGYTVAELNLPTDFGLNGTVKANTTAVRSDPGCKIVPVNMQELGSGNWNNSVSDPATGCNFNWNVSKVADHLFGTNLVTGCEQDVPEQFRTLVFWFFTYVPEPAASVTFCSPNISLWDVEASVSLSTGNVTALNPIGPFNSNSNFSSFSGNVTGDPLDLRAYNGISFPFVNETTDPFVLERGNATMFVLPAAVYQAATLSPEGVAAEFATQGFVNLSTHVYGTYLSLVAKTVYFLPASQPIDIDVFTFKKRLTLSPVATHLLAVGLLILAIFGLALQVLHRGERADLRLASKPGTIASAVTITAKSDLANILADQRYDTEIHQVLRDKRFRIDPVTMKIVMEGEEGYANAQTPRKSMFENVSLLGGTNLSKRLSRRFSRPPAPSPLPPPSR